MNSQEWGYIGMARTETLTEKGREVTTDAPRRPATLPTQLLVAEALRHVHATPEAPSWSHRLLPAAVRGLLADLGWWNNPTPQRPSAHLTQTLAVLHRYGWCQSVDTSLTGRLCIRGAQQLLENAGHVTPDARQKAVAYMQHTLADAGINMAFHAWNDLPDQQFSSVQQLLTTAANTAQRNGE